MYGGMLLLDHPLSYLQTLYYIMIYDRFCIKSIRNFNIPSFEPLRSCPGVALGYFISSHVQKIAN